METRRREKINSESLGAGEVVPPSPIGFASRGQIEISPIFSPLEFSDSKFHSSEKKAKR